MQKKYVELEKKAAEAPVLPEGAGSYEDTLGHFRKARAVNQQSRQSRSSTFFQELAKTSMLGGRKLDSTMTPQNMARGGNMKSVNTVEVQKHLQMQEENYTDIIYKLEHDRMRLRGKDIQERLVRMQKQGGALNEFIRAGKEKAAMNIKLTREKQAQLSKAVENVEGLRQNIKVQMASVKVVDLKKKQQDYQKHVEQERQAELEAKHSAFKRSLKSDLV
jgi:hypothetical protein